MRKIFLLICLIISLRGLSQGYPLTQNLGSSTTRVQVPANGAMNALFINRTFVDTTSANTSNIKYYAGAQIYTTSDSVFWIRNLLASRWLPVGGGSSGGSSSITNIYNNSITNIFTYHDSCVILQTGSGTNIDTICTEFHCGITGWTITGSGTIQICGFVCPDTTNIICHSYSFPPTPFFLFDNGLTQVTPGHVEGGGTYRHNTNFDADYNIVNLYGRTIQNYPYQYKQYQNWNNSSAIVSFTNSTNTSVRYGMNWAGAIWRVSPFVPGPNYPYSGLWFGGNGTYQIGQPSGNLLAEDIRKPSNGIYIHEDTLGAAFDLYGIKWATAGSGAGTTTSSIAGSKIITGYINGQVQFPQYTPESPLVSIDTANNKPAVFDASGNFYRLSYWPSSPQKRFGVLTEDYIATQDRSFNLSTHNFNIYNSNAGEFDNAYFWFHDDNTTSIVQDLDYYTGQTPTGNQGKNYMFIHANNGFESKFERFSPNYLLSRIDAIESFAGMDFQDDANGIVADLTLSSNETEFSHTKQVGLYKNVGGSLKPYLRLDFTNNNYTIGDIQKIVNGNRFQVDDANNIFKWLTSTSTERMNLTSTGNLTLTSANSTGATTSSSLVLNANSLTTGTGFYGASSTLSSGALIDLAITGTAALDNQKGINISLSGSNSNGGKTTYGLYSSNAHAGTSSTNYAGYFSAVNGTTNNIGLYSEGSTYGVYGSTGGAGGLGVWGDATGSGTGIVGSTVSGVGGRLIVNPSSTNTVVTVAKLERTTTGTSASGIGGSLDFLVENAITSPTSNQIISQLTVVSPNGKTTSKLSFTGLNQNVSTTKFIIDSSDIRANAIRMVTALGANVSSANDLTLGTDGNVFHITSNTTINAIVVANWQAGSEITLIFDSTPTVKNNTSGSAGTAVMHLAGAVDFSATANDLLKLVYDGVAWYEVSRSIN